MKYFVVDAFTDTVFGGNPAGVCLPGREPDEALMRNIAAENNLPETAFVTPRGQGFGLRWFTPETEIDLCGHATLASAFVIRNFLDAKADKLEFYTKSGTLTVAYANGLYEMDFPARPPARTEITPLMCEALGCEILEAHISRDLLLLLKDEAAVRELSPRFDIMRKLPGCFGVIATAEGRECDFVSRFFAPNAGIPEDPVTGSSHSALIPFWAGRLKKDDMTARQLSRRGGVLICGNRGERVKIAGKAALYMKGEIQIGMR